MMTREEAIERLKEGEPFSEIFDSVWDEALNMAIKALEQEPKKGRTIDADELLKRIAEKAKTPSLSEDTINGLCGATAIIYDMLNESEE